MASFKVHIKNFDEVENLPTDCSFENLNDEASFYGLDSSGAFNIGELDVSHLIKFENALCFDGKFMLEELSALRITDGSTEEAFGDFYSDEQRLEVSNSMIADLGLGQTAELKIKFKLRFKHTGSDFEQMNR